jgi:hypothetical protein
MAGAVGIVFGLCVLSFTLGAALMYVVLRRREDAALPAEAAAEKPADRAWVPRPVVEPVEDDYDSRPIHRNPVVGLRQLEPALASLVEPIEPIEPVAVREAQDEPATDAEPVVDAEPLAAAENVSAAGYDQDGDLDPPVGVLEAPESTVAADTDSPDADEPEFVPDAVEPELVEPEPVEPEPVEEPVVSTALPPPASPQPAEHTTWVEREDFRARYLRTFEEVRRKAGSN